MNRLSVWFSEETLNIDEESLDISAELSDNDTELSHGGAKLPYIAAEWFDDTAKLFNNGAECFIEEEMTGNDNAESIYIVAERSDDRTKHIDDNTMTADKDTKSVYNDTKPSDGRILMKLRRKWKFGRGYELPTKGAILTIK